MRVEEVKGDEIHLLEIDNPAIYDFSIVGPKIKEYPDGPLGIVRYSPTKEDKEAIKVIAEGIREKQEEFLGEYLEVINRGTKLARELKQFLLEAFPKIRGHLNFNRTNLSDNGICQIEYIFSFTNDKGEEDYVKFILEIYFSNLSLFSSKSKLFDWRYVMIRHSNLCSSFTYKSQGEEYVSNFYARCLETFLSLHKEILHNSGERIKRIYEFCLNYSKILEEREDTHRELYYSDNGSEYDFPSRRDNLLLEREKTFYSDIIENLLDYEDKVIYSTNLKYNSLREISPNVIYVPKKINPKTIKFQVLEYSTRSSTWKYSKEVLIKKQDIILGMKSGEYVLADSILKEDPVEGV